MMSDGYNWLIAMLVQGTRPPPWLNHSVQVIYQECQWNGEWTCIYVALFHSTDHPKHFTCTAVTFTHSH